MFSSTEAFLSHRPGLFNATRQMWQKEDSVHKETEVLTRTRMLRVAVVSGEGLGDRVYRECTGPAACGGAG